MQNLQDLEYMLRFEMITTSRAVGLFIWTKKTLIIIDMTRKNKISLSASHEYAKLDCLSVAHGEG